MATVTGFTSARMLEIEKTTVVDGHIAGGHLILETREGTNIDAGDVTGPIGPVGPDGNTATAVVLGTNLNAMVTPGLFSVDTTTVANSLINWPVEAIPRTDQADADNAIASYRSAPPGLLHVRSTGSRIMQTAEVLTTLPASGYYPAGPLTVMFSRARSNDGVTWSPWELMAPSPIGVPSYGQRDLLAENILRGTMTGRTRTPMKVMFSGNGLQNPAAPFEQLTLDGVQWWRESTGTRQLASGWATIPWQNGFSDYVAGPGWPTFQAIRSSAGIVTVRGLGTRATVPANGTVIGTLPPGMRPSAKLVFAGPATNNVAACTLRVATNGDVSIIGTPTGSVGFIDVSCIMFPAADVAPNSAWTNLTPLAPFSDYNSVDSTYPRMSYWVDMFGGLWQRGMAYAAAAISAADYSMYVLPAGLSTNQQVHAALPSNVANGAVSVHWVPVTPGSPTTSTLAVVYKNGNPTNAGIWVSLAQAYVHPVAAIPESYWRTVLLANSWTAYSGTFPTPGIYVRPDGIAFVRGLGKGGTAPPIVVTAAMGIGDRAILNLMTLVTSNNALSRVSVNGGAADYAVSANSGSAAWLSFDGLHYFVEA